MNKIEPERPVFADGRGMTPVTTLVDARALRSESAVDSASGVWEWVAVIAARKQPRAPGSRLIQENRMQRFKPFEPLQP